MNPLNQSSLTPLIQQGAKDRVYESLSCVMVWMAAQYHQCTVTLLQEQSPY